MLDPCFLPPSPKTAPASDFSYILESDSILCETEETASDKFKRIYNFRTQQVITDYYQKDVRRLFHMNSFMQTFNDLSPKHIQSITENFLDKGGKPEYVDGNKPTVQRLKRRTP